MDPNKRDGGGKRMRGGEKGRQQERGRDNEIISRIQLRDIFQRLVLVTQFQGRELQPHFF